MPPARPAKLPSQSDRRGACHVKRLTAYYRRLPPAARYSLALVAMFTFVLILGLWMQDVCAPNCPWDRR